MATAPIRLSPSLRIGSLLILLTGLAIVGIVVTWAPRPELVGSFGLPAKPPGPLNTAYASIDLRFPKFWSQFIVFRSLSFEDAARSYGLEESWVLKGKGRLAVLADQDEIGRMGLGQVALHRAGPYKVTLEYSFFGRVLRADLFWPSR